MPSWAKSSPSRWATSRPAGSVPKRAPQKTQTEEGTGFIFYTDRERTLLFTDDPTSFRTEATWYHFAEEGRDELILLVEDELLVRMFAVLLVLEAASLAGNYA